jgi:hypothetical protein
MQSAKVELSITVSVVSSINPNHIANPGKSLTGGTFANMSLPDHPKVAG